MDTNRILPGQQSPPSHITSTKQNDGEQAFHDLAKSKGNTAEELAQATTERTRLTRAKRSERTKKRSGFLYLLDNEGAPEEIPIYYTVLDPTTGQIITLRLLAVA